MLWPFWSFKKFHCGENHRKSTYFSDPSGLSCLHRGNQAPNSLCPKTVDEMRTPNPSFPPIKLSCIAWGRKVCMRTLPAGHCLLSLESLQSVSGSQRLHYTTGLLRFGAKWAGSCFLGQQPHIIKLGGRGISLLLMSPYPLYTSCDSLRGPNLQNIKANQVKNHSFCTPPFFCAWSFLSMSQTLH